MHRRSTRTKRAADPVAAARRALEATATRNDIAFDPKRTAVVISERGLKLATLSPTGQVRRVIGRAGCIAYDPVARPINGHVRTQLRCTFEHLLRNGTSSGRSDLPGVPGLFLTGEWAYRYVQQARYAVVLEALEPVSLLEIHPKSCVV